MERENPIEKIRNSLGLFDKLLNDLIISTSTIFKINRDEACDVIIRELVKIKESGKPTVGGAIKPDETQSLSLWTNHQTTLEERMGDKDSTIGNISFISTRASISSQDAKRRFQQQVIRLKENQVLTRNQSNVPTKTIVPELLETLPNNNEDSNVGELRHCFEGFSLNDFERVTKGNTGDLIVIEGSDAVRIVKRFSFSVGLHDRFHSSGLVPLAQYQFPGIQSDLSERIVNDCWPPRQEAIPNDRLKEFNKIVEEERINDDSFILKQSSLKSKKKTPCLYELSENVTYYRDGVNGRPDAILFSPNRQVLGIAEFKGCSDKPSDKTIGTFLKQAAHYQNLVNSKEAFLFVYPVKGAKFQPFIRKVLPESLQKIQRELPILKTNFNTFINLLIS